MPYKDKTKQRAAQAKSQRRRYHKPGSKLRGYYLDKARARRGTTKPRGPRPKPARKAQPASSLKHRAGLLAFLAGKTTIPARVQAPAAKPSLIGTLKPNHF